MLQAAADKALATIAAKIAVVQDARLAHGARCLAVRAVDSWPALVGVAPSDLSGLACEVHEYDGPQGRGWCLMATAQIGKLTMRRVVHHGPETWREAPWFVLVGPPKALA